MQLKLSYTSLDHFWKNLKRRHTIFSLWWRSFLFVYFGCGMGALLLLFYLEALFFSELTGNPLLGYGIAGILELTKFGTTIIRKALNAAERVSSLKMSPGIPWGTAAFQIGLIAISIFCCVITISSYLYDDLIGLNDSLYPQSLILRVESATNIIKEGLGIDIAPVTFVGVFSLLASVLLQAAVYMVFIHIAAILSDDIEHLFEVKMSNIRSKTKLHRQFLKDEQSKEKVRQAKEKSLDQVDKLAQKLLTDLKSHKQ